MLMDDEIQRSHSRTRAMKELYRFRADKVFESTTWSQPTRGLTPMTLLYEHGFQEVGCCKEDEKRYFHPILGKNWVLPITPGLQIE
jgi:hypothetical protein